MISSVINPKGVPKAKDFSRVDEWIFFVMIGDAVPSRWTTDMMVDVSSSSSTSIRYVNLKREGSNWQRSARPNLFYPIYIDPTNGQSVDFGEPIPLAAERPSIHDRPAIVQVWPKNTNGTQAQ